MPSPRMRKSGKEAGLTQCRPCHAQGEIPTSFMLVFRVAGCQLSSCPQGLSLESGMDTRGLTVPATGQAESGLCSHATSWQIVTVFASPRSLCPFCPAPSSADVFVTACQPCETSAKAGGAAGGLVWAGGDRRGGRRYRDAAQSPAGDAAGVRCPPCSSKVDTTAGP